MAAASTGSLWTDTHTALPFKSSLCKQCLGELR